jgi:hypothetical protein
MSAHVVGPEGGTPVRTDRRAPLVAFIVVAIIAVILLVTSVRSQAAPGLAPATHHASGPSR